MKKTRLILLIILVVGLLSACNNDDTVNETKVEAVTAVETVQAELGDLVIEKSLYGRTSPSKTTPVIVTSAGEVDKLEVKEGDKVKKDDILAKIKTPMGIQNLKAPKAGEVIQLDSKIGDFVTEENPFAIIIDLDEMKIDVSVTNNVRMLFEKEAELDVTIDEKDFKATVLSIGKVPDDTGLYPIELSVQNKDDHILPGMIALITVSEKRIKESIILPTEAIVEEAEGTYVYLVDADKVVKVEIEVKATQSDKTAIEGDVEKGDVVVINGQLTLSDGTKVNVVKEGN